MRDVLKGLSSTPKTLPPKYFYDKIGSELFEKITLRVQWDPEGNRFIFQRDSDSEVIVPNPLPVAGPPIVSDIDNKRLEMRFVSRPCPGGPRTETSMKVKIDKVWINKSVLTP